MKYLVTVTRTLLYEGEIEADTFDDAMDHVAGQVADLPDAEFESEETIELDAVAGYFYQGASYHLACFPEDVDPDAEYVGAVGASDEAAEGLTCAACQEPLLLQDAEEERSSLWPRINSKNARNNAG